MEEQKLKEFHKGYLAFIKKKKPPLTRMTKEKMASTLDPPAFCNEKSLPIERTVVKKKNEDRYDSKLMKSYNAFEEVKD